MALDKTNQPKKKTKQTNKQTNKQKNKNKNTMIQTTRKIPKGLKTNETDLEPRTQIKQNIQTTKKNQRTHLKQPEKQTTQ